MNYIDLLKENLGAENVYLNEDMSKHTSFKTGGPADSFVKVDSIEKVKYVLKISKENNIPLFILGNGSNILVTDKGIRGIVCKINIDKFEIEEKEDEVFVTIGSGSKNAVIAQKLLNLEIEGFEFASRNPRKFAVAR
ncbi:MAG: FAD-binding protein [Clostridia bacterium]|nr:FAD-binding protein [Clostridia bacterium]